jgi:methionine transaminase
MVQPSSKLPNVSTSIFAVMSGMANQYQAINLSQGFPDFDGDGFLKSRVDHYIQAGYNQYAPMPGMPQLTEAIAKKTEFHYQRQVNASTEVTVTSGATEALFAAITATINTGDEAIIFDPAYDSYAPAVSLSGGVARHIPLKSPSFCIDWQQLEQTINANTRLIIINSPHNPCGSVISEADLERLYQLIKDTDIILIADEVYEHIIFDEQQHASVNCHKQLRERSFVISSFGKTYHMTGWKIGYAIAPAALTKEFRKIHQFLTFSSSTPMQLAIADMINEKPEHALELPKFYQQKRDQFREALSHSKFKLLDCAGTYFQLADYSAIDGKADMDDMSFCEYLVKEVGVAAIPLSPFYQSPPKEQRLIRFCFAKGQETFEAVKQKLDQL